MLPLHRVFSCNAPSVLQPEDAANVQQREERPNATATCTDVPAVTPVFYPNGDPRARLLLERIAAAYPHSPTIALAKAVEEEVYTMVRVRSTLDFAFVVLSHVLHLPPGAAIALFALSRTAGWIGHAIEQYQTHQLIRPRARYTGRQPFRTNNAK